MKNLGKRSSMLCFRAFYLKLSYLKRWLCYVQDCGLTALNCVSCGQCWASCSILSGNSVVVEISSNWSLKKLWHLIDFTNDFLEEQSSKQQGQEEGMFYMKRYSLKSGSHLLWKFAKDFSFECEEISEVWKIGWTSLTGFVAFCLGLRS